jgi:hypothetical protein
MQRPGPDAGSGPGASDGYLKFWTGLDVPPPPSLPPPRDTASPHFPIRCYFDNDSDELINFRGRDGQVDVGVYRELLRTLASMGYNAINPADQLGRSEFYQWESYRRRWKNYRTDLKLIERLMAAARDEGFLVEVALDLGRQFDPLPDDRECWPRFGGEWLACWKRHLADTPLGTADIFNMRPRSPLWDLPYRCECTECRRRGTGPIMTEVFTELEGLVLSRKPEAQFTCDLYHQGRGMWERGEFRPSGRWLLVAPDNGFGRLLLPEAAGRGPEQWGIYVHAGFWLNHIVQDPHIEALAGSFRRAAAAGADRFVRVNGQSLKNFVLNLELCMRAANAPASFDPAVFVRDWAARLFGATAADDVAALVKKIAAAHLAGSVGRGYLDSEDVDRGFVAFHRRVIHPLLGKLAGKEPTIPIPDLAQLEIHRHKWAEVGAAAAALAARLAGPQRAAFDDQFGLPVRLFKTAADLAAELDRLCTGRSQSCDAAEAELVRLNALAENGSELRAFAGWLAPANARLLYPIPERGAVQRAVACGPGTARPR